MVGVEEPSAKGGKMSERNFPGVPVSTGAASTWSSTTETIQKGGQRGEKKKKAKLICEVFQGRHF